MKREQMKKLTLSKETLQSLGEPALRKVVAGALPPPTEGLRCYTFEAFCG